MKKSYSSVTTVAAVATLALLAGCGGGQTELPDTPEAQAFAYRDALMLLIGAKTATLNSMARGEVPVDEELFVESSQDLAALSQMVSEGFMPEGTIEQSRAMPEIWSDWDDFEARIQEFQDAATELAQAAENGGFEAGQDLVQPVAGTCGDCHRAYRAPEE